MTQTLRKNLVRNPQFYKTFFKLTCVIALQQLITYAVNLADNMMLGRFSEYAMSGASLVNQLQFLLQAVVFGSANGAVVLGSQYWGKGQIEPIKKVTGIAVKLSFLVGVIFFALARFCPKQLLLLLTNDPDVIAEGVKYMRVLSFSYLLCAISNSLVMSLRAAEIAVIGTIMSCLTLIINSCLNYVLIFGNFGAPRLGVEGAAIATTVSRVVELIVILVFVFRIDKKLKLKPKDLIKFDFTYMRDYASVALPSIGANALWGIGTTAQIAILGHMSATTIAANSIASIVFSIVSVVSMSTGSSAAVIMGKMIGENRMKDIKPTTVTLQCLFVCLGIFAGFLLFILKDVIISFYVVTEETKQLAHIFLSILSVSIIFSSYEYPCGHGIVAGGGDTKYCFYVDTLGLICLSLPLAALSAFVFDWPPVLTFLMLKVDQFIKCIPNSIRANRYKWVRKLTRD